MTSLNVLYINRILANNAEQQIVVVDSTRNGCILAWGRFIIIKPKVKKNNEFNESN